MPMVAATAEAMGVAVMAAAEIDSITRTDFKCKRTFSRT
jgi:hypothetical protein